MPETLLQLANYEVPATGAWQTAYTVPAATRVALSSLAVTNRSTTPTAIYLRCGPASNAGSILGRYTLGAYETLTFDGLAMSPGDVIQVWCVTHHDVTVVAFGATYPEADDGPRRLASDDTFVVGTMKSVYTVPAGKAAVGKIVAVNRHDTSATVIGLQAGPAASPENYVLYEYTLGVGETVVVDGVVLQAGRSVWAYTATHNTLTVQFFGEEVAA